MAGRKAREQISGSFAPHCRVRSLTRVALRLPPSTALQVPRFTPELRSPWQTVFHQSLYSNTTLSPNLLPTSGYFSSNLRKFLLALCGGYLVSTNGQRAIVHHRRILFSSKICLTSGRACIVDNSRGPSLRQFVRVVGLLLGRRSQPLFANGR